MGVNTRFNLLIVLLSLAGSTAMAGEGHDRDSLLSADEFNDDGPIATEEQLAKVNELYLDNVKPIFDLKCTPCHGVTKDLPWYYSLPGAKQLIDDDIAEAKMHLDISKDFPFQGHGTPKSDLVAIKETIKERSMPPFRYWIMHWGSSINSTDENIIINWIDKSLRIIDPEDEE